MAEKTLKEFINETFFDLLIIEPKGKQQMLAELKLIFDELLIKE